MEFKDKIYTWYRNHKAKIKKLASPTPLVGNINKIEAVYRSPATIVPTENDIISTTIINTTSIRSTETHNTDLSNNYISPLKKIHINFDLYKKTNDISNIESEVVNDSTMCISCIDGDDDFGLVNTENEEDDDEEEEDNLSNVSIRNKILVNYYESSQDEEEDENDDEESADMNEDEEDKNDENEAN